MNRLATLTATIALTIFGQSAVAEHLLDHPHTEGELVVRFNSDLGSKAVSNVALLAGAIGLKKQFAGRHALIETETNETNMDLVMAALLKNPAVEAVSPNYIGEAGFVPNDNFFNQSWHLEQDTGADIDATLAWDITRGSAEITVAVLDSGLLLDQPEFANRLYTNANEILDGIDNDGNGLIDDINGYDFVGAGDNDPTDEHGHGTWVTSVMGANADDGFGVAGVDHNARILPIRVLGADNRGTMADLIQGIDYAVASGADVINLSLINFPNDPILADALADASQANAIVVACAGNAGPNTADTQLPGAHPDTLSIGATRFDDTLAGFSSTGQTVDFTAPGDDVFAADSVAPYDPNSSLPQDGCSLATPIVSGVIALMLSEDRTLNRDQIEQVLAATAMDLGEPGHDQQFGWGRINAAAAIAQISQPEMIFTSSFE